MSRHSGQCWTRLRTIAPGTGSKGGTVGSNTLRNIGFLVWSMTFFFRLTFCAMDSVHLPDT